MNKSRSGARPRGAWLWVNAQSMALSLSALVGLRMGWLVPLALALFLFALVLALAGAAGPLAPFVYPLL